jgi:hypothetical protein
MAEWFKAVVLKTTEVERLPWVRIPVSPPTFAKRSLRSRLRLASRVRRALAKVVRRSPKGEGGQPDTLRRDLLACGAAI